MPHRHACIGYPIIHRSVGEQNMPWKNNAKSRAHFVDRLSR
uniref:Uncharacterized protein n=1 Tax=Parascaris equorum TaxID=6256 RepID=A0A914RNT5_PAREQ